MSVVGARPNFMKLAPVSRVLAELGHTHFVVHTGQHYDFDMSDSFFVDLKLKAPDVNLGVGSASHAQQTAAIMQKFEPVLLSEKPDAVLVYGDVNSTVAAALVAAKLGVTIGHVEAGLRSRDWSMPEEINRVVTDRLSDLLFAPSRDGVSNLLQEGIPENRIHLAGNVMIDTLVEALPRALESDTLRKHGLTSKQYAVVTLHRPSNVDDPEVLSSIMEGIVEIAKWTTVFFPLHPRTRERLGPLYDQGVARGIKFVAPLTYLEMLDVVNHAAMVLTDSGGLQEETTFLNVPCLTLRSTTERPVTCTRGTNELVKPDKASLTNAADSIRTGRRRPGQGIEGWDGKAAHRIVQVLANHLDERERGSSVTPPNPRI